MKTTRIFDVINWSVFAVTFPMTLALDSWWPVAIQWAVLGGILIGLWLGFRQMDEWQRERDERKARRDREHAEWEQVVNSTGMLDATRRQNDVGN